MSYRSTIAYLTASAVALVAAVVLLAVVLVPDASASLVPRHHASSCAKRSARAHRREKRCSTRRRRRHHRGVSGSGATGSPTSGAPTASPTTAGTGMGTAGAGGTGIGVGAGTGGTGGTGTGGTGAGGTPPTSTPPPNAWLGVTLPPPESQTSSVQPLSAGGAITGGSIQTTVTRGPSTHLAFYVVAVVNLSASTVVGMHAEACYSYFRCAMPDAWTQQSWALSAGTHTLTWDVTLDSPTAAALTFAFAGVSDINAGSPQGVNNFGFAPCFSSVLAGTVCEQATGEKSEAGSRVSMTRMVPTIATDDGYGDPVTTYVSGGELTSTATRSSTSPNSATVHIAGEVDVVGSAPVTATLRVNGCDVFASAWCSPEKSVTTFAWAPGQHTVSADVTLSAAPGATLYSVVAFIHLSLATPPTDGSEDLGGSSQMDYEVFGLAPGQAG
jgi:hypothetical protein